MIFDALLTPSLYQDLTGAAGATPSVNTIDVTQSRELGASMVPMWALFTVMPASGDA